MKSEDDLDNIFKKGMEDPENHLVYNEHDWDALEQMLDAGKKRRGIVYWLPVASSIAALLLLFLGLWFIKPATTPDKPVKQIAAVKPTQQKNTVDINNTTQHAGVIAKTGSSSISLKQPSGYLASNATVGKTVNGGGSKAFNSVASNTGSGINRVVDHNPQIGNSALLRDTTQLIAVNGNTNGKYLSGLLSNSNDSFASVAMPDFDALESAGIIADGRANLKRESLKKKNLAHLQPEFALTVMASSDVNGVNSFDKYSMLGSNFGALFTTSNILKRFSITTGVIYSDKPYAASIDGYNAKIQLRWSPIGVTAYCKMLDIPLNIGFEVFKNKSNKISLGTGLSSYLMLNEKYSYTYGEPHPNWPQSYTVPHSDNYFMSLLNVNATYERRLNSRFGLNVQPYLKIPLTGIGYSDARLQSAGVAVGLSWNINTFKK